MNVIFNEKVMDKDKSSATANTADVSPHKSGFVSLDELTNITV